MPADKVKAVRAPAVAKSASRRGPASGISTIALTSPGVPRVLLSPWTPTPPRIPSLVPPEESEVSRCVPGRKAEYKSNRWPLEREDGPGPPVPCRDRAAWETPARLPGRCGRAKEREGAAEQGFRLADGSSLPPSCACRCLVFEASVAEGPRHRALGQADRTVSTAVQVLADKASMVAGMAARWLPLRKGHGRLQPPRSCE